MSVAEIAVLALIAITVLYWMVILARGRMRSAALRRARRDVLQSVVDPARGGAPLMDEAVVTTAPRGPC